VSGLCWANILECNDQSVPRSSLSNAVLVLQHDPLFAPDLFYYDAFLDRILVRNSAQREWRDDDDVRLTVYLQQTIGMMTVQKSVAADAATYVARQRQRHAVTDYLDTLVWDGTDRIAHAFEDFWGAEPSATQPCEYLRAVSANFFLGLIARVRQPGCQLDNMVIFEGAQGIGKSRAMRVVGGDWYALAAEPVSSKDFFQAIRGIWLLEIGEMDAFSKAERERIKLAISTPTDRYRASWGRRAEDHPRQTVFAGTTNRDDYGNDDTGLRRFWPVRCGDIAIDSLAAIRPQLLAEADVRYQRGESWWDTPTDSTLAVQRDRQHDDVWTMTVMEWLGVRDEVTSADVLVQGLKFREADIGRLEQNRVASILTLNGWRRQTIRVNGRPVKGYRKITEL